MSDALERQAELTKLARLLDVPADELDFLHDVPPGELADFRGQVVDRLFGDDASRLKRVAAASKLLPIPLTVKIAQLAFGPMLCAAAAGLLEPDRAAKIAARVPTDFLADIAVHLDPRRAADVIAAVPAPVVVDVAAELIRRGEHVTMGRFVNYLPERTLRAAVPQIRNDADLLRVAFVMEGKDRLDDVAELARDRFAGLIRTAHGEDLWPEALDLIGHLGPDLLAELAGSPPLHDPQIVSGILAAVAGTGSWDVVLPLAEMLPDDVRPHLAAALGELSRDQMLAGLTAAAGADNLSLLLEIALQQEPAGRARVLELVAGVDVGGDLDEFTALLTPDTDDQVWDALLEVRNEMPATVRDAVAERARVVGRSGWASDERMEG